MSSQSNPFPVFSDWVVKGLTIYRSVASQGMYRPIVILSFYINYLFGGYNPFWFYFLNLFIHLINTVLLFRIITEFLNLFDDNRNKIFLYASTCGLIFFILPQNMMDLFWISGRTDLICELFILSSSLFLIKYLTQNTKKYLVLSITFAIFSYMAKETSLLINLYVFIIIFIFSHKLNKKFYHILYYFLTMVILYGVFRFIIFSGTVMKASHSAAAATSLFGIIKFIFYGGWALFIPFDLHNLIYMINKKNYLSVIFILVPIVFFSFWFLFHLIKISNKTNGKYSIFIMLMSILSLTVYVGNYPQMRLMYIHLPLLLLGGSLFFYFFDGKIYWRKILFLVYLIITIAGGVIEINRTIAISQYYKKLWNILPSKSRMVDEDIYIFAGILNRIGQSQVAPPIDLMTDLKINNNLVSSSNKIFKLIDYETHDFSSVLTNFRVKQSNDSTIFLSANSNDYVFVSGNSKNFDKEYSSIKVKNSFITITPLNFMRLMDKKATEVSISDKTTLNRNKVRIIYWSDNAFKIVSLSKFITGF